MHEHEISGPYPMEDGMNLKVRIPKTHLTSDMTTASGTHIQYDDLENLEVELCDIRFASENICRYCGHANWRLLSHYALATNLATEYFLHGRVKDRKTPGYVAIHDFHEVYVTDVPSGMKKYIPDYCALEDKAERRVHQVLGLDFSKKNSEEVSFIDRRALVTEMGMLGHPGYWPNAHKYGGPVMDFEREIFGLTQRSSADENWNYIMGIYNKTLKFIKEEEASGN